MRATAGTVVMTALGVIGRLAVIVALVATAGLVIDFSLSALLDGALLTVSRILLAVGLLVGAGELIATMFLDGAGHDDFDCC